METKNKAKQVQTQKLQSNQMEVLIKKLRKYGNLTEEYDDTGQLIKISREIPARKTFWDLLQLLIIPCILLAVGSLFTYEQNQTNLQVSQQQHQTDLQIAEDNRKADLARQEDQQRETTLTATIGDMKDLLLNRGLRTSKPGDEVRAVAQAEIRAVVRQLDGIRKGFLIRFLSNAGLLTGIGNNQIISLNGTDLSYADLRGINLDNASLSYADLSYTDLRGTFLRGADLSNAVLLNANLQFVFLNNANLSGANLKNAQSITAQQLEEQVLSLKGAIMPNGSVHS